METSTEFTIQQNAVAEPLLTAEASVPQSPQRRVRWSASVPEDLGEQRNYARTMNNIYGDISANRTGNADQHNRSSQATVLTIAGFFLTGLMFFLSGLVVLLFETHRTFQFVGSIFLIIGMCAVCFCFYMQQKNFKKLSRTLTYDFYYVLFVDSEKISEC